MKLVVHAGLPGRLLDQGRGAGPARYRRHPKCEKAPHAGCPKFVAYAAPIAAKHKITLTVQARVGGAVGTPIKGSELTGGGGKLLETIY